MKITIMSFNLRYDKPDPGERQLTFKKEYLAIVESSRGLAEF